ncbi:Cardiolipin synthase (CMP-forming) [Varanus komodoensis]|nr:Cardiolipin synthase (CMP-forming) [Varanus komodoensis]
MLIPAWLVKGSACGWRLLRSASPGSSFRATAAAAATAATRLGGGARCGDPRATVAASALSGLAAPSSCARRRELLRVRPPGAEQLLSAPSPTFVCPCRGPGQPRRSRTSHEGAPRPPEDLSQRAPGGAPPRTYAELVGAGRGWRRFPVLLPGRSGQPGRYSSIRWGSRSNVPPLVTKGIAPHGLLEKGFPFLCPLLCKLSVWRKTGYENPWTIPNLLSMARIGLAPVLGYLIVEEDFNIALGVFTLAGITDLLDGFIARNWANQKSALGSALDPLADKILISILYISLTYANLIPAQVTAAVRSAFLQLRLIHQLRPYLEYDCLATVTHALVTSRLDFCNALYLGLPLKTVRILQLVQNRAARLLTGTGRYVHMTPVLRQLHWLPIEVRAQFKMLVMTYKALNGLGPGYLKERLRPYMPSRPLRTAGEALLQEPSVKEIRRVVTRRRAFSA